MHLLAYGRGCGTRCGTFVKGVQFWSGLDLLLAGAVLLVAAVVVVRRRRRAGPNADGPSLSEGALFIASSMGAVLGLILVAADPRLPDAPPGGTHMTISATGTMVLTGSGVVLSSCTGGGEAQVQESADGTYDGSQVVEWTFSYGNAQDGQPGVAQIVLDLDGGSTVTFRTSTVLDDPAAFSTLGHGGTWTMHLVERQPRGQPDQTSDLPNETAKVTITDDC